MDGCKEVLINNNTESENKNYKQMLTHSCYNDNYKIDKG